VGANYKRYVLNSEGTLFADSTGKIPINEFGSYVQATKLLFRDNLKLIFSARYDKNENFDGRVTPRFSAVIKVADDNNIRVSYQQAYRFASTQQQYINLRVAGGTALIGGLQTFKDHYHFSSNPVYSIDANLYAGNPQVQSFGKFTAESVNSYEVGYKGLLFDKKLLIDVYGYYGVYKNFISRIQVAQSVFGDKSVFTNPATVSANLNDPSLVTTYSVPVNVSGNVNTHGFGLGLNYALPANFLLGANITSDILDNVPANYQADFDAPQWRVGASLANNGFGYHKRMGFNITWRWQDQVNFEGDFANGVVPAYQTVDAQISYKFPTQKVLIKIGATNLLNQYYSDGFGNASIGGIYYVSIGYNIF
jgi:outer membrane receptor for ferrienterochelin and colicin